MNKEFKVVIEKHAEGYVAYPLGLKGIVVGEGKPTMRRSPMCVPRSGST